MNNKNNSSQDHLEVERFDIIFRIQHIIMFTSFLLLAFTGWGVKYAQIDVSSKWIHFLGGAHTAGNLHRVAGITMILDFIFHVIYVSFLFLTGKIKFRTSTTIIPLPKDITDMIDNFLYFFGLSKNKPRFGKFSYSQKFDYWAVFWGMFIIGLSGLSLAFPIEASSIFPHFALSFIWQLIFILHSDEALLAIIFILFWHFYNEHLKPEVFPMNWLWITGKITVEELKEKHPLEYELMLKENTLPK